MAAAQTAQRPSPPILLPNSLAAAICNLFPAFAYDFFHAVWHGHIVHPVGHFVAIAIRPVKELKRFGRLLGLVGFFVHQDKRGAGNRPAVLARLIGQDLVEAIGGFPVGVGPSGLKAVLVGREKVPL